MKAMNKILFAGCLLFMTGQSAVASQTTSQRAHLNLFVESCTNKQWATCNLARYDIKKAGFRMQVSETGDPYLVPPSKEAAKRYYGTLENLTGEYAKPEDKDNFYGLVSPASPAPDLPDTAAMFFEVRDTGMRGAGLQVIAHNFKRAGIDYDVMGELEDARLEFIRQLALVYTVRGNVQEANRALGLLDKSAKQEPQKNAAKATREACSRYLDHRPTTKVP